MPPPTAASSSWGVCMAPDRILPVKAITKELEVRYVFGYGRKDFAFTIDMLARGRIDAAPLLTETVGWDAFRAAFESLSATRLRQGLARAVAPRSSGSAGCGRNCTLRRGAALAILGTACSHVR